MHQRHACATATCSRSRSRRAQCLVPCSASCLCPPTACTCEPSKFRHGCPQSGGLLVRGAVHAHAELHRDRVRRIERAGDRVELEQPRRSRILQGPLYATSTALPNNLGAEDGHVDPQHFFRSSLPVIRDTLARNAPDSASRPQVDEPESSLPHPSQYRGLRFSPSEVELCSVQDVYAGPGYESELAQRLAQAAHAAEQLKAAHDTGRRRRGRCSRGWRPVRGVEEELDDEEDALHAVDGSEVMLHCAQ